MVTLNDYAGGETAWCPGCGNFGILTALKRALVALGLEPHQILMVSGIGQSSKLPHYLKCNCFNVIHGRTLPAATGAKLANHELTVIAVGGDGDAYAEGGNHFIHALRKNVSMTYLVNDNQIFALTKGQASPTSDQGFVTGTTPAGLPLPSMNPIALAIITEAGYVARGFAGDVEHLSGLIQGAIKHPGFALVDILQPCPTFNKKNTFSWYRERVRKIDQLHDPTDKDEALKLAAVWGDNIPIGLLYKNPRPALETFKACLKEGSLVKRPVEPSRVESLFAEFK